MAGRIVTTLVVFQLLSMIPVFEIESTEGQVLLMIKLIGWCGVRYSPVWIPAYIIATNRKARRIFDALVKRVMD